MPVWEIPQFLIFLSLLYGMTILIMHQKTTFGGRATPDLLGKVAGNVRPRCHWHVCATVHLAD